MIYGEPLMANTEINSALSWGRGITLRKISGICFPGCGVSGSKYFHSSLTGIWHSGYLALKLRKDLDIYYGWARLHIADSGKSITIFEYAYNSIPNQPILAGEKTTPLPLTLLSFNGVLKNNQSVLTWSTTNEINNKGFDIEKSTNGRNYIKIGFVNGKGNTSSVSQYNFADAHLENKTNFYRLKQTDIDGRFSYSPVVQIHYKNTDEYQLTIAPNPFSNSTTVSFFLTSSLTMPGSGHVSLQVHDMMGRLVKTLANEQLQPGAHQLVWNAKDDAGRPVAAGTYILRIQAGQDVETRKLILLK
jgi:hypothetical protein